MKNKLNRLYALFLAVVLVMTNLAVGHPVLAFSKESITRDNEKEIPTLDVLDPVTTSSQIQIDMKANTTTPSQINIHMTATPDTSVNFNWTTKEEAQAIITVEESTSGVVKTYVGETKQGSKSTGWKYFHKVTVDGLKPATQYTYVIGQGANAETGSFKTAPSKGTSSTLKFAYVADTQIRGDGFNPVNVPSSNEAKAVGALFNQLSQIEDLDFTYMAGDITDTGNNESQWEALFENEGAFPTAGADFLKNNVIAITQGNHDMGTFNGHMNVPAQAGQAVYSFEYGPVKFIVLNLEVDMPADRKQQEAFLREEVAKAKENNQWTIVGFHKSIYSGGSHIVDKDVVSARKYWAPILSNLDVDMVLQGHDHVYARGFVNKKGYNANPKKDDEGTVLKPSNVPLYMVGGHAGALKWYGKDDYTVSASDPISPNYEFLDFNSTDLVDDANKVEKFQTYIIVEIDEMQVHIETYMFKYDTENDKVVDLHLADELTFKKAGKGATLSLGSEEAVIGKKVTLPVSVSRVEALANVETTINYDANLLTFESVTAVDGVDLEVTHIPGNIALKVVSEEGLTIEDIQTVAEITFTVNSAITIDQVTKVSIRTAEAGYVGQTGTLDMYTEDGSVGIFINLFGDMNKDELVNGMDALKLMQHLQGTYPLGSMLNYADLNNDGVVDSQDAQMMLEMSVH